MCGAEANALCADGFDILSREALSGMLRIIGWAACGQRAISWAELHAQGMTGQRFFPQGRVRHLLSSGAFPTQCTVTSALRDLRRCPFEPGCGQ